LTLFPPLVKEGACHSEAISEGWQGEIELKRGKVI